MKFVLLVTWFYAGQMSFYHIPFDRLDGCEGAASQLSAEAARMNAANRAELEATDKAIRQGEMTPTITPSKADRYIVSAICVTTGG